MSTIDQEKSQAVREQVRRGYAQIAQTGGYQGEWPSGVREHLAGEAAGCCGGGSCCGPATLDAGTLAEQIGYTKEEIEALPEGANMGLSCGNPGTIASLKPGEVVLDLGAGGGFDCFLAGPKVGETGRVIGVDMTPEMLAKARRNVVHYRETTGLDNVEFRLGEIEHLPVADASVDVVISNCVLNLVPDKEQAWREIARVLKPGGRVAVSDMALLRPLPAEARAAVEALVGCVAGAVEVEEMRRTMEAAGLEVVELRPKPEYVAAMQSFQDPLYRKVAESLPAGTTPADFLTSLDVRAKKAGGEQRSVTPGREPETAGACCGPTCCG